MKLLSFPVRWLLLCLLMSPTILVQAQSLTVRGTVTAIKDGAPLVGVTVSVSGKSIGTQTDTKGQYELQVPDNNTSPVPVVRFADVLLTYAEAENEAAGPANAYGAINRVRDRAGLPALSGLTQAQFRDSVRKERSHELAFEYNRRYDLIRWGKLDQIMGADSLAKNNYNAKKALYPIPENELLLNPKLGQNDGY